MGDSAALARRVLGDPERPSLLAALSDVREEDFGGWAAACPLCELPLYLASVAGHGLLALCDGTCTSSAILEYLRTEAERRRREGVRAWLALRLALTPDAWAGLLLGLPVQPAAIDQEELTRLRRAGLWQ